MKKTHKKILGFAGLAVVAATTAVAVALPGPEASAATSSSMTDNISVRVVGHSPEITILAPPSGSTSSNPEQEVKFDYQGVSNVVVKIEYTDLDGVKTTATIDSITMSEDDYGTYDNVFNMLNLGFGYGDFVLTVEGDGAVGADSDSVSFGYYPVDSGIEQDTKEDDKKGDGGGDDGDYKINFDFDEDGGAKMIGADVTITDQGGDTKAFFKVDPFPVDSIDVSLSDYGLPSGVYTITVRVEYEYKGKTYYQYFKYTVNYKAKSVKTPDTGGLFGGLNISKSDYLTTGLLVFGFVGIVGFAVIAKKGKKTSRKR